MEDLEVCGVKEGGWGRREGGRREPLLWCSVQRLTWFCSIKEVGMVATLAQLHENIQ